MRILITGVFLFSSSIALAGTDSAQNSSRGTGLPTISATETSTDMPLERGEDKHPCYKDSKVQPSKEKMNKALHTYMKDSRDPAGSLRKFEQATIEYEYQVEECKKHPPTS